VKRQAGKITSIAIAELSIKPVEDGKKNLMKEDAFVTYVVDKPQTLFDIAIKIPGVSIDEILRLNSKIVASRTLKPGTKLRIRKF
jgi:LysM repeat protein